MKSCVVSPDSVDLKTSAIKDACEVSLSAIAAPRGRRLVKDDLNQSGQLRRELLPEPRAHVFDRGILESRDLVQVAVVEGVDERLHRTANQRVVVKPARLRIDFALDGDLDFETVAVHPAAFVIVGHARERLRGFEGEIFGEADFHRGNLYTPRARGSQIARLLEEPTRFLQQHAEKCIIIDEVQRAPHLFPLLRALIDQNRTAARFMLLGSASPWLLRNASESLAGRIAYTELTPFLLGELPADISMETHWFRGGFPNAVLAPSDSVSSRWLENLLKSFVERDVRLLGYDMAPAALTRFVSMLTSLHGQLLNMSDLARSLGMPQPMVKNYLDVLEGAFLIHRLQPFFSNATKRLVKSPKIYFRDSGLLHRASNVGSESALHNHILVGSSPAHGRAGAAGENL